MGCIFKHSKNTNTNSHVHHRQGFTLIETMLAVAILLVLSMAIYQGFMATIKYTWNTALFEKSVVSNAGTINLKLATTPAASITPSVGIYLSWTDPGIAHGFKVLGGQKYSAVPTVASINLGDSTYQEIPSLAATHQKGFSYLPALCSKCHSQLTWVIDGTEYYLVCPNKDISRIDMGSI